MKGVLSTGFADVTAAQVYYEVTGAGEAIVLLHSAATDHRIWDDQFEKFAKSYMLVRYDARGFGESEMPGGPISYADDLARLLAYLDVERARLVGLGEGGAVALDYALRHPERVTALVIASPTLAGLAWSQAHQNALRRLDEADSFDAEGAVEHLVGDPTFMPPRTNTRLRLQRILVDNAHMIEARRSAANGLDALPVSHLAGLTTPTLILIGEKDSEAHQATCRVMLAHIPGASAATVLAAGHFVNLEQPETFNRLVLEFFASQR